MRPRRRGSPQAKRGSRPARQGGAERRAFPQAGLLRRRDARQSVQKDAQTYPRSDRPLKYRDARGHIRRPEVR